MADPKKNGATAPKAKFFELDTDFKDIAAGAAAGAVIGWTGIAGKGEKKVMNGAILGALVAFVVPTFSNVIDKAWPA